MLKTNSAITLVKRGAVLPTDTQHRVMYGKISEINFNLEEGMDGIMVQYMYYTITTHNGGTETEWKEEVPFNVGSGTFAFAEAQAIKDTLIIPEGLSEKDEMIFKYKEALRIKMAERFGIEVSDIVNS